MHLLPWPHPAMSHFSLPVFAVGLQRAVQCTLCHVCSYPKTPDCLCFLVSYFYSSIETCHLSGQRLLVSSLNELLTLRERAKIPKLSVLVKSPKPYVDWICSRKRTEAENLCISQACTHKRFMFYYLSQTDIERKLWIIY